MKKRTNFRSAYCDADRDQWIQKIQDFDSQATNNDITQFGALVWGENTSPVQLKYEFGADVLEVQMHLLPPIRVAHGSLDLWLLPLVDSRASSVKTRPELTNIEVATWRSLLNAIKPPSFHPRSCGR